MSAIIDDPSVRMVDSFAALVSTPFEGVCNALVWERDLSGDFGEVIGALPPSDGVHPIDEDWLRRLELSPMGQVAVEAILEDLRLLREAGHQPELNGIETYPTDPDEDLPTDVYSWHVDSATLPTDTFLCCYAGRPSQGLRREDAIRTIDVPELRARLLQSCGGVEGPSFAAFLEESHQDLHFVERKGARPFSMGRGHLWRVAVRYPNTPVPAFVHRAPKRLAGDERRLLLIS